MSRSPLEIRHRFAQEVTNLKLLLAPPSVKPSAAELSSELLPKPAWLSATPFANKIRDLADRILRHQFPLFSTEIATGPNTEWRRDYVNNKSTGLSYFRMIPYLDVQRAGDHKWIWELNRHQHLVVLAQAFYSSTTELMRRRLSANCAPGWRKTRFNAASTGRALSK